MPQHGPSRDLTLETHLPAQLRVIAGTCNVFSQSPDTALPRHGHIVESICKINVPEIFPSLLRPDMQFLQKLPRYPCQIPLLQLLKQTALFYAGSTVPFFRRVIDCLAAVKVSLDKKSFFLFCQFQCSCQPQTLLPVHRRVTAGAPVADLETLRPSPGLSPQHSLTEKPVHLNLTLQLVSSLDAGHSLLQPLHLRPVRPGRLKILPGCVKYLFFYVLFLFFCLHTICPLLSFYSVYSHQKGKRGQI